jgi:heme exporter protein D
MHWGSLSEFWAMGGYGFYVWGSYLVTAAVLAAEILVLRSRRKDLAQRLRAGATEMDTDTEARDETQA